MKLTIERADLLAQLAHVHGAVDAKALIPILKNLRLEAADNTFTVAATNLDMFAQAAAPCAVAKDGGGALTVPARLFGGIVKSMPDGCQIKIAENDGFITVATGRSRFKVMTLPADDFPAFRMADGSTSRFDIAAEDLAQLLGRTAFAANRQQDRPHLCGVYLCVEKIGRAAVLRAVATDGHRLAHHSCGLPEGAGKMPGIIVPLDAAAEIIKLAQTDSQLQVAVDASTLSVASQQRRLTTKLLDGTYPDYKRVVPDAHQIAVEVDADKLRAAATGAMLVVDKHRNVALTIKQKSLQLACRAGIDGASADDTVSANTSAADGGKAPELTLNCNVNYLHQMLECVAGNVITLQLTDNKTAFKLHAATQPDTVYLLMPTI